MYNIMCMSFIIDVYCLPFSIHQAIENQEVDKDDIESNDVVILQESSDSISPHSSLFLNHNLLARRIYEILTLQII